MDVTHTIWVLAKTPEPVGPQWPKSNAKSPSRRKWQLVGSRDPCSSQARVRHLGWGGGREERWPDGHHTETARYSLVVKTYLFLICAPRSQSGTTTDFLIRSPTQWSHNGANEDRRKHGPKSTMAPVLTPRDCLVEGLSLGPSSMHRPWAEALGCLRSQCLDLCNPSWTLQTSFYVHMFGKLFSPLRDERLCINISFRF